MKLLKICPYPIESPSITPIHVHTIDEKYSYHGKDRVKIAKCLNYGRRSSRISGPGTKRFANTIYLLLLHIPLKSDKY